MPGKAGKAGIHHRNAEGGILRKRQSGTRQNRKNRTGAADELGWLTELVADALQQRLREADSFLLGVVLALVLDTDVAAVTGFDDDPEHAVVVGAHFFSVLVELVGFRADGLGEGHQLAHALVAVVPLVAAQMEVAEVRQRPDARMIGELHDAGEPGAVRGVATVILDDDVDAVRIAVFAELAQRIGGAFLDLLRLPVAAGIDAYRVTTEE